MGGRSSNKKKTCLVFMVLTIMGVGGGQHKAEAQFSEGPSAFMACYSSCFLLCFIIPGHTTSYCSLECLKDCIIPKSTTTTQPSSSSGSKANMITATWTGDQFCELGCASVLCSNISTKRNPEVVKVAKCVGTCSKTCTNYNNNHSSP